MPRINCSTNTKPTIGIIGSNGKFGRSLTEHFCGAGYSVIGSDISTALTNNHVVADADVVIIAVDIYSTQEVIREIAPLMRKDQLLMDITSVKRMPCDCMLESASSVIGAHPMWNPNNSWDGQKVVLCPIRPGKWLEWVCDFFIGQQVNVDVKSPEAHDKSSAMVQGIPHAQSLIGVDAMRRLGADIKDAYSMSSPIYEIRLGMMGRLLAQDPRLYAGIMMFNDETLEVLRAMSASLNEIIEIIEQQDADCFVALFKKNAEYLGRFTAESMEKTNKLIAAWKTTRREEA